MELTIGLVALILTSIGSLWKTFSVISSLDKKLLALDYQIDNLSLLINGHRERMEHINTRLGGIQEKQQLTLDDVEGYLQKNTPYERRGRG